MGEGDSHELCIAPRKMDAIFTRTVFFIFFVFSVTSGGGSDPSSMTVSSEMASLASLVQVSLTFLSKQNY